MSKRNRDRFRIAVSCVYCHGIAPIKLSCSRSSKAWILNCLKTHYVCNKPACILADAEDAPNEDEFY